MNSEEFYTKVKGFAKLNPQMMFIIESVPKEDQARQEKARAAWLDYLAANNLKGTVSTWKFIWAGGGKAITVPAEDPRIFDLKYHPEQDAPRRAYGARWQARDPSGPNTYGRD
jgi:hypothetical protein